MKTFGNSDKGPKLCQLKKLQKIEFFFKFSLKQKWLKIMNKK